MIKSKITLTIIILTLTFTAPSMASAEAVTFKEYLEKANTYIKEYRHFEASDALQEATKLGGEKHPSLHMRLAILYYGLGLIPEAIAEGEKAVALAPSSKWYKYDLAKFYYVDKLYDKAEQQFTALLKVDPGFTLGYYYLAKLYFQKKEYDMAWLSLARARMLGHRGKHLEEKLAPFTTKPKEDFKQVADDNKLFRFIKLPTAEKAQETIAEIRNGKLFENLELELKKKQSDDTDFGVMMLSELRDTVADSLRDSAPFSSPVIVKTGPDYSIMQRIVPFDPASWQTAIDTASQKIQNKQANTVAATAPVKDVPSERADKTDSGTIGSGEPTESIPPTSKPKAQQLSTRLAAFYALDSWKVAWETQDVAAYLAAYSTNFTPVGDISLEAWKKKRTSSLSRPKFIRIDIKDSIFEMVTDEQVLITFKQSYESETYQDEVLKALTMEKETAGWKITQERELQTVAP